MDTNRPSTQPEHPPQARMRPSLLTIMRVAAALVAAGAVSLGSIHAAPIGGTLTGKVVMKTAGASLPSAPLPVTLLYFNPGLFRATDEAADSRTTTTAADGSFTFAGLDTSQAGVYRVIVQYKGVAYEPAERDVTDPLAGTAKSRAVRFSAGATTVATEVPVFEPTVLDSGATFTITSHQIIMNEVRPQFYSVLEALQINNPGDRTLAGALSPDGSATQGAPLVFTTPANAQTIATNRIDLIAGADLTGRKLTLRMPIPPGSSDITVTYDLPGSPSGFTFTRTLDYAAAKLQVLVSDSRQALGSQSLRNDGPIQAPQGATPFRQFSADAVQAGQTFDLLIGPSPSTPAHAATKEAPKSRWQRIRERGTVPLLLVLAVICLSLMVLILRAPVRTATSPPNQVTGTRGDSISSPTGDSRSTPHDDETAVAARPARVQRARGRPHDYDIDDAERAIEEANQEEDTDSGHTRL